MPSRPARLAWSPARPPFARRSEVRSSSRVACGGSWSGVPRPEEPLPADTEARLVSFTELVATAISNAESRVGTALPAEEQAALRQVATLVAGRTSPEEVFAAVTEEIGRLLRVEYTYLGRYEPDRMFAVVASWEEQATTFAPAGVGESGGGIS